MVEQAEDGVVGVGSVVEVEDESGGRFEVEISSVGGGISTESPLGAALVGAKVGESVQVLGAQGLLDGSCRLGSLGLVEAALGLVEALARERLDRVGRARDQRLGVVLERAEHVVRDGSSVAPARAADAGADAEELRRAERLPDRAEAVVARETAPELHLDPLRIEVDVVVDDGDLLGRELEEARCGASELPERFMYVSGFSASDHRDLGELPRELGAERPWWRRASSSTTIQPVLCRSRACSRPGLPRPTTSRSSVEALSPRRKRRITPPWTRSRTRPRPAGAPSASLVLLALGQLLALLGLGLDLDDRAETVAITVSCGSSRNVTPSRPSASEPERLAHLEPVDVGLDRLGTSIGRASTLSVVAGWSRTPPSLMPGASSALQVDVDRRLDGDVEADLLQVDAGGGRGSARAGTP